MNGRKITHILKERRLWVLNLRSTKIQQSAKIEYIKQAAASSEMNVKSTHLAVLVNTKFFVFELQFVRQIDLLVDIMKVRKLKWMMQSGHAQTE